jgi:hypothetical protein
VGLLTLLLLAAAIFVIGNLILLPLWLAATSLAGILSAPGRFLSVAGNRRLRQNHALEHATLNVLEERLGRALRVAGQSRPEGFVLRGYGDPATLRAAAEEGLARLKNGERRLAVHRRCGTSMATANLVSSVTLLVVLLGLGRLSLLTVVLAMVVANLSGPTLGRLFQRFLTTCPEVGDVFIIGFDCRAAEAGWGFLLVNPSQAGVPIVCFVRTAIPRLYGG